MFIRCSIIVWAIVFISTVGAVSAQKKAVIHTAAKNTVIASPFLQQDKIAMELSPDSVQSVQDIASYMRRHFTENSDKIRGAFVWVARHISYDIDNMFAINFFDSQEEKLRQTLKTHKGICEQYAALFNHIADAMGFKSFMVIGYTRQAGFTDFVPHAWSAIYWDEKWHLYDPTWASGSIVKRKFVPQLNNRYFDIAPDSMIIDHFPFDYIWQLKQQPVSAKYFSARDYRSATPNIPVCHYDDSIRAFFAQDTLAQLQGQTRRLGKIGISNSIAYSYMHDLTVNEAVYQQQKKLNASQDIVDHLNRAMVLLNDGKTVFNNYILYRNSRFKPAKSDDDIRKMLDSCLIYTTKSDDIIREYGDVSDANQKDFVRQLTDLQNEITNRHSEEKIWLDNYLSKGKIGRALIMGSMRFPN